VLVSAGVVVCERLFIDSARIAFLLTAHALPQLRRWYFGWAKYAALVLVSAGVVACGGRLRLDVG
jgi:hypothetical protein